MARQKNYYSSRNKKTKDSSKILGAFIMILIAATIALLNMIVELAKWGYTSFKNRQR